MRIIVNSSSKEGVVSSIESVHDITTSGFWDPPSGSETPENNKLHSSSFLEDEVSVCADVVTVDYVCRRQEKYATSCCTGLT